MNCPKSIVDNLISINMTLSKKHLEFQQNLYLYALYQELRSNNYQITENYFELEYENAFKNLNAFAKLPSNWDGYGAKPIKAETIQNIKTALNSFRNIIPAPDLTPNPHGTVSLEWKTTFGNSHLEIGINNLGLFIQPVKGETLYLNVEPIKSNITIWFLIANNIYSYLYPMVIAPINPILVNNGN